MKKLSEIKIGETAFIKKMESSMASSNRLVDMGLALHSPIRVLNRLPFGGNLIVLSDYGKYTLRAQMAEQISVSL